MSIAVRTCFERVRAWVAIVWSRLTRHQYRGLSDAVIDQIEGGRWSIRRGHFGLRVGVGPTQSSTRLEDPRWYFALTMGGTDAGFKTDRGASKALQTHLLSRCSTERRPIGDSAMIHPSAGAEEIKTDHVNCGAYKEQPYRCL